MSNPHLKAGFDEAEPEASYVLLFSIAIIITIVATMLFVTVYYDAAHDKLVYERQQLPINEDLRDLRTREDNFLHSYGYVDKQAGQIRVPIDRAMELVLADAAEGKPKYPTTPYQVKKEEPVAVAGATPQTALHSAVADAVNKANPAQKTPGGTSSAPAAAAHK